MRSLPWIAVALSTSATAAPLEMAYSGRVVDALGAPAQGATDITVSLYTQQSGGTPFWTQDYQPNAQDGFFSVVLNTDINAVALDSDQFAVPVYVGLTVASANELVPRSALLSVPHAAQAQHAQTAIDAQSAVQAQTATLATTGESLVSPNWGRLIVDRSVDNVTMPSEWTTTYMGNNIGRTWIWSADGPNFRDPLHCNPLIQVYDQETSWKGQYIVTVESATRLNVQWSGWYLRVNNSAGSTVDQGNGNVTATLSFENGLWRVQHMNGVVRTTPFECH